MKQQVNLFNVTLIEKKSLLTLLRIVFVCGVFLVCFLGWSAYLNKQLSKPMAEHAALEDELMDIEDSVSQTTDTEVEQKPDQSLMVRIKQLEATKQLHAKILNHLSQKRAQDVGLADYMRGLARQTVKGVWLTGFTVREDVQAITLRGRTLKSEILPEYIKKLGQEPLFSGVGFAGLEVSLPTPIEGEVKEKDGQLSPLLEFIEFELRSLEPEENDIHNKIAGVIQ